MIARERIWFCETGLPARAALSLFGSGGCIAAHPADCLGKAPGFEWPWGVVVPTDSPKTIIPFDDVERTVVL